MIGAVGRWIARNGLTVADFASESGHWYAPDGSPAYTMKGANGQERAVTLRDARKSGLLPSVTTICRLEAKPQLERWKIEQGMLSCLTLPRLPGESEDAFIKRALDDSKQQAIKAAERGSKIHGDIEHFLKVGDTRDTWNIVGPVIGWLRVNFGGYAWSPERSFAGAGFGGKIDLHGVSGEQAVVIDFKVKSGISGKKILAYDEHITQLAAYAYGLGAPIGRCINLFIDADVPGVIVPHEWSTQERDTGWEAFSCLLKLWRLRKGYAP
jgi:hypothetical protein